MTHPVLAQRQPNLTSHNLCAVFHNDNGYWKCCCWGERNAGFNSHISPISISFKRKKTHKRGFNGVSFAVILLLEPLVSPKASTMLHCPPSQPGEMKKKLIFLYRLSFQLTGRLMSPWLASYFLAVSVTKKIKPLTRIAFTHAISISPKGYPFIFYQLSTIVRVCCLMTFTDLIKS